MAIARSKQQTARFDRARIHLRLRIQTLPFNRVLKNVASGLQSGAPGAQEPECTEGVHEGESEIGVALPRPLAAPGDRVRRAGPPKAAEHDSNQSDASPNQGRAVVFQHPVKGAVLVNHAWKARDDAWPQFPDGADVQIAAISR